MESLGWSNRIFWNRSYGIHWGFILYREGFLMMGYENEANDQSRNDCHECNYITGKRPFAIDVMQNIPY